MRTLIAVAFLSFAAATSSVQAEDAAPTAPAEQCIRDNAAKVEAAIGDLNQAVDFLVTKICAIPLARLNAHTMKVRQETTSAQMKAMCDKRKAEPKKDDSNKSFDICSVSDYTAGFLTEPNDDVTDEGAFPFAGASPTPDTVALASSLLLDLRLSHLKSGQPH